MRSLEAVLPEVEALDGTRILALHVDANDAELLHFYELYESEDAFNAHTVIASRLLWDLRLLMAEMPDMRFTTPVRAKGFDVASDGPSG